MLGPVATAMDGFSEEVRDVVRRYLGAMIDAQDPERTTS